MSSPPRYQAPRIVNSIVEFELGPVNPYLQCRLCDGYFRDPITITECLHTFCASCLYYAFSAGFNKCPTCDVQLGPQPMNSTLHDRIKEELVDRVLFPHLREKDEEYERKFYAERGIALKKEFREEEEKKVRQRRNNNKHSQEQQEEEVMEKDHGDELDFTMEPSDDDNRGMEPMPPLNFGLLNTSGRIKILHLKRFLLSRLGLHEKTNVEILIRDSLVGNELSLTFIERTMWLDSEKPIEMKYRYAVDQD